MGDVRVTWSGDSKDAARAAEKLQKQNVRLMEQLRKVKSQSTGNARSQGQGIDNVVKKIGAAVGAYASMQTAIRLVTAEVEKQQRVQLRALNEQTTLANARKALIRNLGNVPQEVARSTVEEVRKISQQTGVKEVALQQAASSVFSAKGSATSKQALQALRETARFVPDDPQQIAEIAGVLFDLSKVTGAADPKRNLGFLSAVGAKARVTSPQLLASNVAPSLIGQAAFGAQPRTAGALFAALTTGSGDVKGAISGTGAISLAEQLREFLPEQKTLLQRLRTLQADPGRAQAFLEKATFEKKVKGPIEQLLLDPRSLVRKEFESARAAIPRADEAGGFVERIIKNFATDPLETTARTRRTLQSGLQQLATVSPAQGQAAAIRETLVPLLEQSGASALGAKFEQFRFETGTRVGNRRALETAIEIINRRAQELEDPVAQEEVVGTRFGPPPGQPLSGKSLEPSESAIAQAALLERIAKNLEDIKNNQKKGKQGQRQE